MVVLLRTCAVQMGPCTVLVGIVPGQVGVPTSQCQGTLEQASTFGSLIFGYFSYTCIFLLNMNFTFIWSSLRVFCSAYV